MKSVLMSLEQAILQAVRKLPAEQQGEVLIHAAGRQTDPHHSAVTHALQKTHRRQEVRLCDNGLGLSMAETDRLAAVIGVQVHNARLAASMYLHGVNQLLTLNVRDFQRFDGLKIIHPDELR